MTYDDDFDGDEWIDDEGDPEDDVLDCPSCGRAVHEDTQQCPHCGDWITPVGSRSRAFRWAWLFAAVLVILAMLRFALR